MKEMYVVVMSTNDYDNHLFTLIRAFADRYDAECYVLYCKNMIPKLQGKLEAIQSLTDAGMSEKEMRKLVFSKIEEWWDLDSLHSTDFEIRTVECEDTDIPFLPGKMHFPPRRNRLEGRAKIPSPVVQ